jgi:hypothetical protein
VRLPKSQRKGIATCNADNLQPRRFNLFPGSENRLIPMTKAEEHLLFGELRIDRLQIENRYPFFAFSQLKRWFTWFGDSHKHGFVAQLDQSSLRMYQLPQSRDSLPFRVSDLT